MKTMLKKIRLIAVLLFTGLILGTNLNVSAVDKTLSVGTPTKLDSYIAGTSFNYKVTSSGKVLYCINRWKNVVKNTSATLVGEKDAGYAYIVANGYPYKSITGDKYKDYYITQSAVWWYIDDLNGNNYSLSKEFKTTANDKYGLRNHIKALVAGAKKARSAGYQTVSLDVNASDTRLHMNNNGYFVSNAVTVNTTGISTYEVAITNAPEGTVVIDANGNSKTKFSAGETFAVKVPEAKVTELSMDIKVRVSATGSINKVYEYKPTDSSMQNFITGYLVPETKSVAKDVTLNISTSKVSIVKLDKDTNKALAGAVLVLKNSDGKELSRWTTSTKSMEFKNLSNGTYTVEEVSAPEGYEKAGKAEKFTITDSNKDVKVIIYNTKKEEPKPEPKPQPVVGNVTIIKIDKSTNQVLAGAVLVIKNAEGTIIDRFTTTTDSYKTTLEAGTYTIEEESAPAGYKKSNDVITFTVDKDNTNHEITFENFPEIVVPNTATSSILTTILGIGIISSAVGLVYKNAKKAK